MRLVPLLLTLLACDPVITQTLDDVGTVCVDGAEVSVDFGTCLSSSCDTLVSAGCTATLEGTVVTVHAQAVIDSQGKTCTADCGLVSTTCALPDLTGLTGVTLTYGASNVPIDTLTCAGTP